MAISLKGEYIAEELKKKLEAANSGGKDDYELGIYYGCKRRLGQAWPAELETSSTMRSTRRTLKRNQENNAMGGRNKATITIRGSERDEILAMILDNNIAYTIIQPIVIARDRKHICIQEAPMRILVPMRMSPLSF